MFSLVLPGVPVKLDLFHAVQRFLSALPRSIRVSSGIVKEYGMIFEDPSDLGDVRKKCTPDAYTIARNLDNRCQYRQGASKYTAPYRKRLFIRHTTTLFN